jgi:hypothetical protein
MAQVWHLIQTGNTERCASFCLLDFALVGGGDIVRALKELKDWTFNVEILQPVGASGERCRQSLVPPTASKSK